MTRAATVDVGTNSVLLLVVESDRSGSARILDERCRITRLGQGLDRPGQTLAEEAVERTLAALGEYAEAMSHRAVEKRAAIGTAALRDATDSGAFCSQAEALLGCPLEVISGEREASLSLAGVRGTFGELPAGTVLFDVGGGSTELTRVGGESDTDSVSLPLGAVRLSERHLRRDPPGPDDLGAVREAVRRGLDALPAGLLLGVSELIGLAGTVTTLCTVKLGLVEYSTEEVNGQELTRAELAEQIRRYASLPLPERRRIPGLEPARADVILGGALVVEGIMDRSGAERLRVCDRGVRWGRLWELLGGG